MDSTTIRKKFLEFFEKKGHTIVPSSSLIPADPSVLLTTAGMQQFKPYYTNEKSPHGDNAVSIQKCFRTSDLNEIGDESHLSFFEMLGNFSFGGYFKKECIKYTHEFITKEMGLKIDYVSVFAGDSKNNIPLDKDSEKIWEETDSGLKIIKAGREDNFWGPTGNEGPCGPTTEIYIKNIEIWNLVFNEFYCDSSGKFTKLKTPGVDTGMGLERLAMVSQNKNSIFETDLFASIMKVIKSQIPNHKSQTNSNDQNSKLQADIRILVDHVRGAVFLIADGVEPSNLDRGYILRRLIRKSLLAHYKLNNSVLDLTFYQKPVEEIIKLYGHLYRELKNNKNIIFEVLKKETEKFSQTLEKGMNIFKKRTRDIITGELVFDLYQTYGFPPEVTQELIQEQRLKSSGNLTEKFEEEMKKHQKLSRTAAQGMFISGLAGHSKQEIRYHTATHLLLAALRQTLGEHILQKGSNINPDRLRLDFSYPEKLTEKQKKAVEDLVNEKIKANLTVVCEEMTLEEAREKGALGVFEHKYGDRVKVYGINNFSREICGGPHAGRTGELGRFRIKKEESISAGIRRIRAILE